MLARALSDVHSVPALTCHYKLHILVNTTHQVWWLSLKITYFSPFLAPGCSVIPGLWRGVSRHSFSLYQRHPRGGAGPLSALNGTPQGGGQTTAAQPMPVYQSRCACTNADFSLGPSTLPYLIGRLIAQYLGGGNAGPRHIIALFFPFSES